MKQSTKTILGFIAGAAVGAVVSAIVTKKVIESKYEIVEDTQDVQDEPETLTMASAEDKTYDDIPEGYEPSDEEVEAYEKLLGRLTYHDNLKAGKYDHLIEEANAEDAEITAQEDESLWENAPVVVTTLSNGVKIYESEDDDEYEGYDYYDDDDRALPIDVDTMHGIEDDVDPDLIKDPYIITHEDFGLLVNPHTGNRWETDSYEYYEDGYVTDSYGLPLEPFEIVALFGEIFESGWPLKPSEVEVLVRNEERRMDFSVTYDDRNFLDVASPRIRKLAGL